MKIRRGFVTNSSSSSFILRGKEEKLTLERFKELLFEYIDELKAAKQSIKEYVEECKSTNTPTVIKWYEQDSDDDINSNIEFTSEEPATDADIPYIRLIKKLQLDKVDDGVLNKERYNDEWFFILREYSEKYYNSLNKEDKHGFIIDAEHYLDEYFTCNKVELLTENIPGEVYLKLLNKSLLELVKCCDSDNHLCQCDTCRFHEIADEVRKYDGKSLTSKQYENLYRKYLDTLNPVTMISRVGDLYMEYDHSIFNIEVLHPFIESIAFMRYVE